MSRLVSQIWGQLQLVAEAGQRRPEEVFKERRGPVFVGVGEGGLAGRLLNAQMNQAALTAGEAVADFPQRVGPAKLAEQHGDELRPTGESFGGAFGPVLFHQRGEFRPRKMMQQLIEQACRLYHVVALVANACGDDPAKERVAHA